MSPLPLPFPPDALPLGPPAARACDGAEPVAPAAGELPRVLPGDVVLFRGKAWQVRPESSGRVVELMSNDGYAVAAVEKVTRV